MPQSTKTADIMTADVFYVNYEDTISKAETLMKNENIRHVPVVQDGKYVGMITEGKILEYTIRNLYNRDRLDKDSEGLHISDYKKIMIRDLPFLYPEDSIAKATELMLKKKIDALPVIDWDKNLVGIVTSIDLLLFFNKKLKEEN